MKNVADVQIGAVSVMALKNDGTLWTWGSNMFGQLGNGTNNNSSTPKKIMEDVVDISLSYHHCAALKSDGTLWMWGHNEYGELGDGSNKNSNTPIKIMDNVTSVSAGYYHSAAIKNDGSLWAWGSNVNGQLGDGTKEYKYIPIKIMDNVMTVSLGGFHSSAITTDGSLWMWGFNSDGELGDGSKISKSIPIKIMDNVSIVSLGYLHSAALKTDGSLWTWGSNEHGELGDGTTENKYTPVKIMDNVIVSNFTQMPQNNPVISKYEEKNRTLKLGKEDYIAPFIDGIYSDIPDNELNITNSNENVLEILRKEFSISDPVNPGDMCVATASAYVKALSPGTSTLTFYCSGKEMGKINVTVEAIIADTISDDTIMRATVLHNNKGYHLHKDSIPSPAERLNDEIKKSYQKSWASTYLFVNDVLGVLTLHFKDGKELNTETYYETILADILENDTNGVWDKTYSVWKKGYGAYNDAIVQKIIGKTADIDKIKTSTFMKNNEDKKVLETIIDYSNEQGILKDVTIKVDLLDKLSVSADLVGDFFDALDEMYAYSAVQQEKIDFLKELKQNTSNSALSQACDNLIADIKFAHENATLYFVSNFGKDATYDLFKFSLGIVAGVVLQYISTDTAGITPYIPGITEAKAILDGGQFIANNIINADDISKNILTVSAYTDILQETKNVVNKFENQFVSDSNIDNALKFIGSADIFKSVLLQSYDVYIDYNKAVQKGNNRMEITGNLSKLLRGDLISFIKNMNKKDSSFDDNTSKAERMKQNLKDMDFYSDEFVDIAAYISKIESTTPSNWAKQYIDKAIETDLLPEYLRGNYQNNITRAEFCTLITRLIEIKKDDAIQEIVKKAPYNPQLFKDSYYSYVYYMACLGIVNGVNEDEFNPLGEITREQAATLLMRTAEYFEIDTNAQEYNNAGVSDWAKKGVNFVIQNNIMTGTDNGFEPQGKYTKEQAITTFVRFYDNLK